MASINTTARLESKIDALRESLESKYRALLWVIGGSAVVISLLLTVFGNGAG